MTTSKERMQAAMRGDSVDRPPIWLREGFAIHDEPASEDHFTLGWQADPLYRELLAYVRPHVDDFVGWNMAGFNRALMIPPDCIRHEVMDDNPQCVRHRQILRTPRGELHGIVEQTRGTATTWTVKHPVESEEDLRKLAEVPFEIDPSTTAQSLMNYRQAKTAADNNYLLRTFLSSPIVIISGCMDFALFLELSLTRNRWFHQLLTMITERNIALLNAFFAEQIPDTSVTFGGSEQCTPPMMAPSAFDEYVVPYDGALIQLLKQHNILVQCHCHGKVRHALEGMIKMGVDATDPVEPPPAGDVTYAEARAIADGHLTLMGNLEWDELVYGTPATIKARVQEILSHGCRRLILGASAGPISAIDRRLFDNYKAWIDAAIGCAPSGPGSHNRGLRSPARQSPQAGF